MKVLIDVVLVALALIVSIYFDGEPVLFLALIILIVRVNLLESEIEQLKSKLNTEL